MTGTKEQGQPRKIGGEKGIFSKMNSLYGLWLDASGARRLRGSPRAPGGV